MKQVFIRHQGEFLNRAARKPNLAANFNNSFPRRKSVLSSQKGTEASGAACVSVLFTTKRREGVEKLEKKK